MNQTPQQARESDGKAGIEIQYTTPDQPTATATRFTITWTQQGYKVSRPNIEEAEVVLASDYDAAQAALAEAKEEVERLKAINAELTAELCSIKDKE